MQAFTHYVYHNRWVEQDPYEMLRNVETCIEEAVKKLKALNISEKCIKGTWIFLTL